MIRTSAVFVCFLLYFSISPTMIEVTENRNEFIDSLILKASESMEEGILRNAIKAADNSLRLMNGSSHDCQRIMLYKLLARIHGLSGDYVRSLEFSFKALALSEELGDSLEIKSSYKHVAFSYALMTDFEESVKMLERSFAISVVERSMTEQEILTVLLPFLEVGRITDLRERLQVELNQSSDPVRKVGYSFISGAVALKELDFVTAEREFRDALSLSKALGYMTAECVAYLWLAKCYMYQRQFRLAKMNLDKANTIADCGGYNHILFNLYECYVYVSTQTKDGPGQLFWQENLILLGDSLHSKSVLNKISSMRVRFDHRRKIELIEDQRKVIELHQSAIRGKERLNRLVVFGLILVGVIILLFVRENLRRRRINENLESIVRAKTRDLELTYRNSQNDLRQVDLLMKNALNFIRATLATAKGKAYILEKENGDEEVQLKLIIIRTQLNDIDELVTSLKNRLSL